MVGGGREMIQLSACVQTERRTCAKLTGSSKSWKIWCMFKNSWVERIQKVPEPPPLGAPAAVWALSICGSWKLLNCSGINNVRRCLVARKWCFGFRGFRGSQRPSGLTGEARFSWNFRRVIGIRTSPFRSGLTTNQPKKTSRTVSLSSLKQNSSPWCNKPPQSEKQEVCVLGGGWGCCCARDRNKP